MKSRIGSLLLACLILAIGVFATQTIHERYFFDALGLVGSAKVAPANGTGITVTNIGELTRQTYKVSLAKEAFTAAAVTQDFTLATIPAKTRIVSVIADVTTQFACAATCTSSTLSMVAGHTAGGNEYLLSYDADAAAAVFGDVIAEVGGALTAATTPVAAGIGHIKSWSAATALTMRFTSGTGNIGTGTATNLSQGSVTFYITTEKMP